VASKFLSVLISRQLNFYQSYYGNKASIEFNCFLYKKILKTAPVNAVDKSNEGTVINFLQVDSQKITQTMSLLPLLITVPLQLGVYSYMLFTYIGLSFLFGFGALALFLFINLLIQMQYRKKLKELSDKKDERMAITTETINNLKVIKLYGWEDEFLRKINEKRDEEVHCYRKSYRITNISQTMLWSAPIVVSISSIWAYQYFSDEMDVSNILTCLNIFLTIQDPIKTLPMVITMLMDTLMSIGRIEDYLNQYEIDESRVNREQEGTAAIKVKNANFSWEEKMGSHPAASKKHSVCSHQTPVLANKLDEQIDTFIRHQSMSVSIFEQPIHDDKEYSIHLYDFELHHHNEHLSKNILTNINLEIQKGEFVAIIGDVGSGKSSLLMALMNNMIYIEKDPMKTKININGKVSYASQIPWIQNDTLRNNILFYQPYDEIKYDQIVEMCQLKRDFDMLIGGDMIEIGEKGVNLSGGQKARISIARALYSDSDIIILDDPISALDAQVADNIVKKCFLKHMVNKTRILVTHAFQYLQYVDRIIYMDEGKIIWEGKYDQLIKQKFFINYQLKQATSSNESSVVSERVGPLIKPSTKEITRITKDEEQEIGSVSGRIYLSYIKYMGGCCVFFMVLFCMILWQGCKALADLWLIHWTRLHDKDENIVYFWIYSGLALGSTLFIFFRILLLTSGSISCAKKLHTEILEKLIRAPINLFHDQTPKGQILNRLSKDLANADAYNMFYYGNVLIYTFAFIGAISVCSYVELQCLIFVPFILFFGWIITRFYISGSRDLSRLEGILRSPILNLISETIPGTVTIRAYEHEDVYLSRFYDRIDDYFKIKIYREGVSQWFGLSLDLLSMTLLISLVVYSIIYRQYFIPQTIGIMLTYTKSLQNSLFNLLQALSNLENGMVSLERILQYQTIPCEKPNHLPSDDLLNWPTKGHIRFQNYSIKYRPESAVVLKNLNFEIMPFEKVGVVGRTGSGKSTLCLGLFRILEPFMGTVYIDDVDITTLGLQKLRSSLTIIPQDPNLMEGTLKSNIDPLNLYSKQDIKKVMEMIGFWYICESHEDGLEQLISESGGNLSVGEKQLICITRAILRRSRIVIMDEATANIDYKTEQLIQSAIKQLLSNSTVITIAHRIKTIIDYDKILVLRDGEMIEFDDPKRLIENKNSLFYELYKKSSI
jgi:ATP-binding cassette subfamily C (CFTR/MRP) protein 2